MSPLLWEKFFERRPPDGIWLERIAVNLARIGFRIEQYLLKDPPEIDHWLWWQRDTADADPQAGPGVATEEEIRDAWGGAYDTLRSENAGE